MFDNYGNDKELERKLLEEGLASLKRGKSARRNVVLQCALVLGVLIAGVQVFWVFDAIALAVVIAVASLCVSFAVMSMSASLNWQMDMLTLVVTHYAQNERRKASG